MSTDTEPDIDDEQDEPSGSDKQDGSDEKEGKNALEWSVVALGAVIVLFVFGYLTYRLFGEADLPPDLRITLGTAETRGALVLVPVEVKNDGGLVAQEATVEVCAGDECAELAFQFVPHSATRKGQVGFSAPLAGPLRSRIVSYRE